MMWILFVIFLLAWIVSFSLGLPFALSVSLFALAVGSAAVALLPHHHHAGSDIEGD
ncbi:MAG TPA: hypothetical protein VMT82_03895 [candidate division Zixibacteria bacterium]|nr:hypothetical protein [candidate division Zixibacteria bacterium]